VISLDRIVITGYGVKGPGFSTKEQFKNVLEQGICTHTVTRSIMDGTSIITGAVEGDYQIIDKVNYKRYPRHSRLAIAATIDAVNMANLYEQDQSSTAVILGTSAGGMLEIEKHAPIAHDIRKLPIHSVSLVDSHTLSSSVASHIGAKGQVNTISSGCASSLDAIQMGKLLLQSRMANACIVGGSDASLCSWTALGFSKLKLLALNTEVQNTGVPFSTDHNGFVMAEGAGILVMERENDALKRGATILGYVENVFSNNEGLRLFETEASGESMTASLKGALGGKTPTFVNSQALGIQSNDRTEAIAHNALFSSNIPITSIKGMTGHTFGSMGALQLISSLLSMEYNFIPPTIKTNGKGFENIPIALKTTYCDVSSVAITTHGSGGNNTSMLVSRI
jgi:3-oxoacyl-(acyl-carrier-protein) synthase